MLKTRIRQIVVVGVLIAIVTIMFIPVMHRVEGKLEVVPLASAKLRTYSGGYLRQVLVRSGDRVEAGQLVAVLEDDRLVTRARIARLAVEETEIQLARVSASSDPNAMARLRNQLTRQLAELESLASKVDDLEIRSPIAGVVVAEGLSDRIGDYIARGRELCEVLEPTSLRVSMILREPDYPLVKAGMPADIAFAAWRDEKFSATVTQALSLADPLRPDSTAATKGKSKVAKNSEGFRAYFDLDNPGVVGGATGTQEAGLGRLRPGMTGTGSIVVGKRSFAAHLWDRLRSALRSDLLFF